MPLVIAQCSGQKVAGDVAGFDKYVTRNHVAIRDFMMDGGYQAGWDWSILSAEHGLVHPTTSVADYDTVLTAKTVDAYVAAHGAQIAGEVDGNDAADAILFVGSKLYLDALKRALPHRKVKHVGAGGRGCGDYFSALKEGFAMYGEDA